MTRTAPIDEEFSVATEDTNVVPSSPPPPAWGAPVPPGTQAKPPWSARKVITAVVIAVAVVAAGGGVIYAATNHSSSTSQNGGPGGGFGGYGRFGGGPGGAMTGLANALHGDFVASSGNGYVTERLQTGTVTAVSGTSISLKSADNYAGTYTVSTSTRIGAGSDTISSVKTGDTVTLIGTVSGNTVNATTIEDRALQSQSGPQGAVPGDGGGPPGN